MMALVAAMAMSGACPAINQPAPAAATQEIRVALNVQNTNIVSTDPESGTRVGVPLDLSRALGTCLGSNVRFIDYQSVGAILDDATNDVWDIAFVAYDPSRSGLAFTAPYMLVENTYLVPAESQVKSVSELDRDGVRIAVPLRSAPDAFLTRTIAHATLVREPTGEAAFQALAAGRADALASDRNGLGAMAARLPGSRILAGSFVDVPHAIALPARGTLDAAYVRAFVGCATRTEFVARSIAGSGIRGVRAAPPQAQAGGCGSESARAQSGPSNRESARSARILPPV